jgi:hypothetical protein
LTTQADKLVPLFRVWNVEKNFFPRKKKPRRRQQRAAKQTVKNKKLLKNKESKLLNMKRGKGGFAIVAEFCV